MNRAHLLGEAKSLALALSETYAAPKPEPVYAAGRDAYAALMQAVADYREAGYASEHDALIATKLAYILTGAGLAEPQWVDQQIPAQPGARGILELDHGDENARAHHAHAADEQAPTELGGQLGLETAEVLIFAECR